MSGFRLAAMSREFLIWTVLVFPLPILVLLGVPICPFPAGWVLIGVSIFMGLIWLQVWTYMRPSRFEISPQGLRVVWPIRSRWIDAGAIRDGEILSWKEFSDDFGRPARVGAGGLWGVFGLLVTRKGWLNAYLSRREPLVLLRLEDSRPLLITPENPEHFLEQLRDIAPGLRPQT